MTILSYSQPKYTVKQIQKELIERFIPWELNSEAEIHLNNTIENSNNSFNFIDFFHYHYTEGTIQNVAYNMITNAFSFIK